MHAIKGGWVGQTFALAKCNDSGAKKSRIRRSKEERKAIVESFIKKYQKLNDGSFPSLNLTHKEAGGSFYTIREIVREIIQENRVLGPAKLIPEEQNTNQFLEQDPLRSISIEPQTHLLVSSDDTHTMPDHQQDSSEVLTLNSRREFTGPEHQRFDNGVIINGNWAEEKIEESDKFLNKALEVSETLEATKNVKELEASTAKVTSITAGVIVETFPIRSAVKPVESLEGSPNEAWNSTGNLEEKETENMGLELGNGGSFLDTKGSVMNCSSLVDEKAATKLAVPLPDMQTSWVDEDAEAIHGDPTLESSCCSATENGVVHYIQDSSALEVEPIYAPNGTNTSSLSATDSSSSCGDSISKEVTLAENEAEVCGNSLEESNSTLDRINLESWAGASTKSTKPETNPILAFFKVFMDAFVKFWSE
ncbi:uncharacterized protein LOC131166204 [Malania oleifera]|uniref:uncharacterized protein LOC131166204 n=1 Tax=Malania oleifera TaxID=397392 RepID=UPI0025AE1DD3|nr:uncharacterized protein LOC131166204 [Malania oleifera]XP_057980535.1 uncharacterized protein LOC131166204 [Malania oleifera]